MRSAGDIIKAIIQAKTGFKLMAVLDKIHGNNDRRNYVLAWDDGNGHRREAHCSDSSLDFEQQCEEILCVLSCNMLHDFEKNYGNCWLPKFTSLEELDLKLEALGI